MQTATGLHPSKYHLKLLRKMNPENYFIPPPTLATDESDPPLVRFFMHDVAAPAPPVKAILEATTEDGNSLISACNLGGQEGGGRRVHLRVGQLDASVPPWQVLPQPLLLSLPL
jgi:hypothetical protein